MAGLAHWCYRHRITVTLIWVGVLVALFGITSAVGTKYSDSFSLPGTESSKALDLLMKTFPKQAGDTDQIVWHTTTGTVNDVAVKSRITSMLATVAKSKSVAGVTSPYSPQGVYQISRDAKTAYANVTFTKDARSIPKADIHTVVTVAQAAAAPGLEVALGGTAIAQFSQAPPSNSEAIGILAAAIILFLAFGSLLGMLLPLLIAIVALGSGLQAVGLLTHVITIGTIAPTLAALIGLGVGIDYALFIVTRYRNSLKAGMTPEEAVVRSLNTSGRAVIFAGTTVCIALLGLLILRLSFLAGMGIASAITVVFTMVTALTLLPAMLGFFGMRVLSRRERRALAENGPSPEGVSGGWARWARFVQRRPVWLALLALAGMLVLSIPTFSLRLGLSDAGNGPRSSTTRQAYDMLAKGFGPGTNGPLQLVAETATAADQATVASLVTTLKSTPGIVAVEAVPAKPGASLAIISVVPTTAPQDAATSNLIQHLRKDVIPAAVSGTNVHVYVGGATAIFDDFASVLTGKLPLFIGVIVGLGFLLLVIAFRSLLVPATAALMNLLAAGAAFGVIVAVFQWGWGSEALGIGKNGPVEAFLPVIMLAILFGLSMDYQVFLVSRMHEEWVHTKDNTRSVTIGQATTGRVISAAAAIMIFVFGAFVLGGERVIAEFGIGLSTAVFLDAFMLRTILVPAAMHLFGAANWWLPGWLDRILPHLSVEPPDEGEHERPEDEIISSGKAHV